MKIVHCADIHFDSPFSELPLKEAQIRRDDIRKTFARIIDLTKELSAECLVIAGDLFDGKNVSKMTLDFIVSKFAEIKNTHVLICAGNHDPKNAKSYYNLINWGENVHIFDTVPETLEIDGLKFAGVSFFDANAQKNILSESNLDVLRECDVLVMHANLGGDDYNPVSKEFISSLNAKYFASGHIHKSNLEKIGNTLFCYPGCPEGRGFDELGKKGVYVADVTKTSATAEFYPLSQREYEELNIDVSGQNSYEGILGKILLEGKIEPRNLYKIVLKGECDFVIDTAVLKDAISAFFVKIKDETVQKIDYESLADDFTLKGIFVKKMLEKMKKEGETEELKRALSFGLSAIRKEKVSP